MEILVYIGISYIFTRNFCSSLTISVSILIFRKIFNYWDINGRGIIDTADVYAMIKRFGISINMNEARALVAASDSEQRGYLDLNAFMELIFNDDEQINVQLS